MSNAIINLTEPVQHVLIIGAGVIAIIVGFWAMFKGRGCDTEKEYYSYKDTSRAEKPKR
jgi:hypothetical protein